MNKPARKPISKPSPAGLKLLPSYVIFLMTLLSLIMLPIPMFSHINPAFAVSSIIYFTLWQPRFTPLPVVFFCGLFFDVFQSSLFGTHALLYLFLRLICGFIRSHIGFHQHTGKAWAYFSAIAMGYFLLEWLVLSLQVGEALVSSHLIQRDILTITLYPILHIGFSSLIAQIQQRA